MLNDLESVQGCLPSVRSEFRENDIEDTELSKLGELLDVLVHEVSSDIQSKTNRPSA